ncbi:MAG: hypothetical protein KJ621_20215 [Proteobacteria bacterium]|nr:hypothetical protein [Pseudomonadota bacterium]MBU1741732.1 hypothetical protein [Pseudomonadota bacterium]
MKRKLNAILGADVKGYSRLMADDEAATVETQTAHRQVFRQIIEKHHGRVIDSPGDNLLAEFNSAVNAVAGAEEIQRELPVQNAALSDGGAEMNPTPARPMENGSPSLTRRRARRSI